MSALIEIRTDKGSLDLPKDFHQQFYVTRQVFNLNDFETRNADFTKTIQVPATPTNVALLDSVASTSGTSGSESNKIQCSIYMNGIQIAPIAWLLHFKTTKDRNSTTMELGVFYGNFNLFDTLSGDSIDAINWADLAVEWELASLTP